MNITIVLDENPEVKFTLEMPYCDDFPIDLLSKLLKSIAMELNEYADNQDFLKKWINDALKGNKQ